MSAKQFVKTVKNARRGVSFSQKHNVRLGLMLLLFVGMIGGSALLVWWLERNFTGSYLDSLWSVLFTLIGQGEFASSPHTFWGRFLVFLISIFGVAVLGVIFANVLQRIINSKIKQMLEEMMGINSCKFEGHVVICGWNGRGPYLIRELMGASKQVALIAKERPDNLNPDVFFVQGNPSDHEALTRGGITKAQGAIILSDPEYGDDDSHTIFTGLAVETLAPDVYSVIELHNPENERYARYAHVDDILYTDSLIADITAMCTHNEGISAFIRDVLSTADDGNSFASDNVPIEFDGRTVAELFAFCRKGGTLPVAVLTPPEGRLNVPVSEWVSNVNPPDSMKITLPMKVVCLVKNSNYSEGSH